MKTIYCVVISLLICTPYIAIAQSRDLKKWPKGTSPKEVGMRLVELFLNTPHTNFNRATPPIHITYPEVCTWYGALKFAREINDELLMKKLADRFQPLFKGEASLIPVPDHVDRSVFAAVPFELFLQTKDAKYLRIAQDMADKQWEIPDSFEIKPEIQKYSSHGLSWQTRMWVDDMFMISAVQVQAYRATKDEKYINRAANEMAIYLDSLQKPNGLFYHAPDVPFFWNRGNGWMAAGMAEILTSLPKNNPHRARILQGYKTMMASLLKYQTPRGMWRQLIDEPTSWEETSGTGMFSYAMTTGVKKGWLDKKIYTPAVRKAWLGLVANIDSNANVKNVSEGTNKKNDKQFYLDRKRVTGDLHGQAPVLWSAAALLD